MELIRVIIGELPIIHRRMNDELSSKQIIKEVPMGIDLKKEQQASIDRPRQKYSITSRIFFWSMNLITGKKTTLAKAKLIEMLASIPYRAWEIRQYARLTRCYRKPDKVQKAQSIMAWGREAQDNEYWHLIVINEKMKADGIKDPWYLFLPIPFLMIASYVVMTRIMALLSIRSAFKFNAHFEDHAEHVYAQFVEDNPELENQSVDNEKVREYLAGYKEDITTWADVFRRIGLDERDHMNNSFVYCGKPERVVQYEGMEKSD
ncbi:MAG TPA: hypothetical protein ENL03_00920 [Phycisphaerae bacterium]|nr:hypothetical protein [Phycisphaerae bacterium]